MTVSDYIAKKREEKKSEGIYLGLLGILFLPITFVFANMLYFILASIFLDYHAFLDRGWIIANVVAAIIIVIDVIWHPEEDWVKVKFSLASAFKNESDPVITRFIWQDRKLGELYLGWTYPRGLNKGVFGGVPYMTAISDPVNIYSQIRRIANAFGNFVLGGPRLLKRSVAALWLRSKLDDNMVLRLQNFIIRLKSMGEEYTLRKGEKLASVINDWQILPLAIELGLVGMTTKKDTGDYVIRAMPEID
jgi:MFS family permease